MPSYQAAGDVSAAIYFYTQLPAVSGGNIAKSFSCSVITSFLLMITLTCATFQASAALEARPVVAVEFYSPLGFTTFTANRPNTYTLAASWQFTASAPGSSMDLYFGMLSPDMKTVYTWTLQEENYVLAKGMHPIMAGVSMNTPATYRTAEMAGRDLKYTVAGNEQLGMYLVFALAVGAGKDPADPGNWAQIEMKPLFVQQQLLLP